MLALTQGGPVLISIEYPIMKASNVTNYRKQITTLYAIQHELVRNGLGQWLIEVNPTESKLLVTEHGNASKGDIIAVSPFEGDSHTIETMADAWMHAVAGRYLVQSGKIPINLREVRKAGYEPFATRRLG